MIKKKLKLLKLFVTFATIDNLEGVLEGPEH